MAPTPCRWCRQPGQVLRSFAVAVAEEATAASPPRPSWESGPRQVWPISAANGATTSTAASHQLVLTRGEAGGGAGWLM
jgi:hypothetical protein